jgi:putative transposase
LTVEEKRLWIDKNQLGLSVTAQCECLGVPRSSYYYKQIPVSASELWLMQRVDEIYTAWPFYGSRKITQELKKEGHNINRKHVQRIMQRLGLASNQPGPNTSKPHPEHIKFPYLLNGLFLIGPLEVWSTDITYIRLPQGFVYLVAVIDWFSRLVLSYRLSNSLETSFCLEAFEEAIECYGRPKIFNTDQGVQFTSQEFVSAMLQKNILFSMDGRGRALDNIFVERLWRSVKYENVYLQDYQSVSEARIGLAIYFRFYNTQRMHQSLGYKTPHEVHHASAK